jgi:hypothetical protein
LKPYAKFIGRRKAKPFLVARAVWPILFATAMAFAIFGVGSGFLLSLAVAAPFLAFSVFWRCPNCKKFFALKVGAVSIAWPYFNSCCHCGAKIEKAKE